jgi:hypothetical protein
VHRPAVADAFDAHEVNQLLAVLGLRQDHDRPDLRDRFGENRRRQHRRAVVRMSEISLVQGDVLDTHDSLVGLELRDAIDQQKRIAVGQDSFDG